MAQQTVNNGDGGLAARNKVNQNFTELYASGMLPIKLPGVTGSISQAFPANCMINMISIRQMSGTVVMRIGTSPGGNQVLDDTTISGLQQLMYQQYSSGVVTLYFTYTSGTGILNIRIDYLKNYI